MCTEASQLDRQIDLAWKWFEYHAKQRMTMFHFYLIITGILAAGFIAAYKDGTREIATAIALLGILASLSSVAFDRRNRAMTSYAEDILEKLEDEIYPTSFTGNDSKRYGLLRADRDHGMREGQSKTKKLSLYLLKHKTWIHAMQGSIALCFAGSILLVFRTMPEPDIGVLEKELARIEALRVELKTGIATKQAMTDWKALHNDLTGLQEQFNQITERINSIQTHLPDPRNPPNTLTNDVPPSTKI